MFIQLGWQFYRLRRRIRVFKLVKPSPSSDPNEQGGPSANKHMTIALIIDCPIITVHARKCYNTVIVLGTATSLVRYSTYQKIYHNLKTAIQSTSIHLNTADGSHVTALPITTLQLWTPDVKFCHNFIICDRLPNTEILFGINVQKKFTLSYAWEKNCYIQKEGRFLIYTRNCEQKANVAIVNSTFKIPPRQNSVMPMKIKGHTFKGQPTSSVIRTPKREGPWHKHHWWNSQH